MSRNYLLSIFCLKPPTAGPIIEFPGSPSSPGGPLSPGSPYPKRNKIRIILTYYIILFSFNFESYTKKEQVLGSFLQ